MHASDVDGRRTEDVRKRTEKETRIQNGVNNFPSAMSSVTLVVALK